MFQKYLNPFRIDKSGFCTVSNVRAWVIAWLFQLSVLIIGLPKRCWKNFYKICIFWNVRDESDVFKPISL